MLKAALVLCSLLFCFAAFFAPPPTAEDAAEWRQGFVRVTKDVWRSAVSTAVSALPSSGDVGRYIRKARLRAESIAEAELRKFREPGVPVAPESEPLIPSPEGGTRALDEHATEQPEPPCPAGVSNEAIRCPPEAITDPEGALPRPWCDPRVRAVLQLVEEEQVRRGEAGPPLCGPGLPAPQPLCE